MNELEILRDIYWILKEVAMLLLISLLMAQLDKEDKRLAIFIYIVGMTSLGIQRYFAT